MKFVAFAAWVGLSALIVVGSPTNDQVQLSNYCSGVGKKCNALNPCCDDLECKGAGFKRTCELPGGPDCTLEGRPCSDLTNCCTGLKCSGAAFKRSCIRVDTDCTPQGSDCGDSTTCCGGLTCKGSAFGRTCS
ncbi:hypothetical protein RSOLAG1IB_08200 [Rhizoctonia solani AG-1 IB]|uniref:Uncharacterized protein n=1 Tax=Thanatephorus cucumeris (strain AG1-IB / isolate 7/3/14) TaxID=1108050 RepID=A0A0B7FL66_THACB|nr:hypothetical protein RSOLAG1IB_08200 [Rhizoctonia solani AG-1 IB]